MSLASTGLDVTTSSSTHLTGPWRIKSVLHLWRGSCPSSGPPEHALLQPSWEPVTDTTVSLQGTRSVQAEVGGSVVWSHPTPSRLMPQSPRCLIWHTELINYAVTFYCTHLPWTAKSSVLYVKALCNWKALRKHGWSWLAFYKFMEAACVSKFALTQVLELVRLHYTLQLYFKSTI